MKRIVAFLNFASVPKNRHWSELCLKNNSDRAVNSLILGHKTSQLMMYREIISVCSDVHKKYKNIFFRYKV